MYDGEEHALITPGEVKDGEMYYAVRKAVADENEEVNANKAIVTVEINVYDYNKSLKEILEYRDNYIGEFMSDGYYDESKYIDYKIDKLKQVSDKIKYTLNIELTKIDNKWYIDDLSKEYLEKINGVYNY